MKKTKKCRLAWGVNLNTVREILILMAGQKPGRLLDVGTGQGVLAQKFADLNYQVFGCDLDTSNFLPQKIPIKKVDLNQKTPYQNQSFNYIICSEVIEHLENPWHLLREMARILKKKGILVISLPNFSNLISRIVFFSRGNFREFYDYHWQKWGHINPITYPELSKILQAVGFKIEAIKTAQEFEKPFRWPLIQLQRFSSTLFHLFKLIGWQKDWRDKTLKTLETRPLLFGENIIIRCKKVKN